jgi:hypothetical protein
VEMVLSVDDINVLAINKEKDVVQQKITMIMKQLETWFQLNNPLIYIKEQLPCHSILVNVGL